MPKVRLDELEKACKRLGIKILESKKARYPRTWWIDAGYVAIEKKKKNDVLIEVSRELKKVRGKRIEEKR